jgi:hypothetical protein
MITIIFAIILFLLFLANLIVISFINHKAAEINPDYHYDNMPTSGPPTYLFGAFKYLLKNPFKDKTFSLLILLGRILFLALIVFIIITIIYKGDSSNLPL